MKILLIEDEEKLASFISKGLVDSGYACDVSHSGSNGIEMAAIGDYDLILLDIMLPGQDGFEVIKNLRKFKIETPVIFVSALNETEHVINGLDLGAIDYLKKPFDLEELKARIRTVDRRFQGKRTSILKIDNLHVDLIERKVVRNSTEIDLSKREFSILELLLRNTNRVLSKTEITQKIWNIDFDMSSNVIEVHLHQLRKKVDFEGQKKLIHTQVGFGYKIIGELIKA